MKLFEYLINQSIQPKGFVGNAMLKMMNNAHKGLFELGISNMNVTESYKLLDLGFGGLKG